MQPTATSRPLSWPGGRQASPWVPPDQRSVRRPTWSRAAMKPCDGTRIVARVGSEAILESEVVGAVNEVLEQNKDHIPPDQLEAQRELLIQKRLKSLIETKLIFQDAKRTIPDRGLVARREATDQAVRGRRAGKDDEEGRGRASRREFDQKLRTLGTSLEQREAGVHGAYAGQRVDPPANQARRGNRPTTRWLLYYREHLQDFTTPARRSGRS